MDRVLALDLSLNHTGYAILTDPYEAYLDRTAGTVAHGSIKTPGRRHGETDWAWNRRRSLSFQENVLHLIGAVDPTVIVVEVSKKVFARQGAEATGGRYGAGAQYRAGQGLGRAMGWLDGALNDFDAGDFEVASSDIEVAKRAITGRSNASKEAVHDFLERIYGWDLTGWDPNEVDALSLGLAHLQIRWEEARDARRGTASPSTSSPVLSDSARPPTRRTRTPTPSTGDAFGRATRGSSGWSRTSATRGRI